MLEKHIQLAELFALVKEQFPKEELFIKTLENCKGGYWRNEAFYQFVDATNANQPGSAWQFSKYFTLEHPEKGTIIIDWLKDDKIGGIEFFDLIDSITNQLSLF